MTKIVFSVLVVVIAVCIVHFAVCEDLPLGQDTRFEMADVWDNIKKAVGDAMNKAKDGMEMAKNKTKDSTESINIFWNMG